MTSSGAQCYCGLFAIGLCSQCQTATCGMHGSMIDTRWLCSEHSAEAKTLTSMKVVKPAALPTGIPAEWPATLGRLQECAPVELGHLRVTYEKKILGTRRVETFVPVSLGWILGMLTWELRSDGRTKREFLTMLSPWYEPGSFYPRGFDLHGGTRKLGLGRSGTWALTLVRELDDGRFTEATASDVNLDPREWEPDFHTGVVIRRAQAVIDT